MAGFFNPHSYEKNSVGTPQRITQCGKCGLASKCISPKMAPTGRGERRILFVAEAPGKEEDARGIQLIGDAGQCLRSVLDEIDVDLEDCWKTNAVICRPPQNKIKNDMIECCRPSLLRTINELKPNVIIALGSSALQSLMYGEWKKKLGPISKWVGWSIPSARHKAWICPTYHPSYIIRMGEDRLLKSLFKRHLANAIGLEETRLKLLNIKDLESKVEIITSSRLARLRVRDLAKKKGCLAFDYETTGLKPDRPEQRIVSTSFCLNGDDTFAYLMDPSLEGVTRRVLQSERLKKIASNLKFEERWTIAKLGTGVKNWYWDTMIAAHLLDNRPQISSIKFQSYIHFGVADYDSHIEPYIQTKYSNQINRIHELNTDDLLLYNGLDSLLEYMVMVKQRGEYYGTGFE